MDNSKNKDIRPWFALAGIAVAAGVYFGLLRPRHLRWGTTTDEEKAPLPGDHVVPHANRVATHGITIDAPADCVWPWLVQLGRDKAGFYSYTALENLFGCQMGHADTIHPSWQDLDVGDDVLFHPKAPPVPVLMLERYRYLVLGQEGEVTWGFFLNPIDETRTRLVIRSRTMPRGPVANIVNLLFWEPAHFVMERKMMLTVKRLAEDLFRQAPVRSITGKKAVGA
ncbi:MAG: hypothetical protein JSS66_08325 [Armatimonadetes bacterium]|nr:hypothetical protein [Armatimonadota bacterium]